MAIKAWDDRDRFSIFAWYYKNTKQLAGGFNFTFFLDHCDYIHSLKHSESYWYTMHRANDSLPESTRARLTGINPLTAFSTTRYRTV